MLVKLKELSGECSHIDNVEHVCFPWAYVELCILTLVNQCRIRDRLSAVVVICRQKVVDQIRSFDMVHISERQSVLPINTAIVC